jgi:autotransporter-associated beta strand protein
MHDLAALLRRRRQRRVTMRLFNHGSRTARRLRAFLLTSSALCAGILPAAAQDATWGTGVNSGDFNTGTNWDTGSVPTGTAYFGTSGNTALSFSNYTEIGGWTFNAGADNYTFTLTGQVLNFTGAGIVVNGGSATIVNNQVLYFSNNSTLGSATFTNNSVLTFQNNSSAGNGTITNGDRVYFNDSSSAGSATIINNRHLLFGDTSTAGSATITTNSGADTSFNNASTGGSARFITNAGGSFNISGLSAAGLTTGSIEGAGDYFLGSKSLATGSNNLSTEVSGTIQDGGPSGGTGGSLIKQGTGTLMLTGANTYTGGTTISAGTLQIGNGGTTGSVLGDIANNAALVFNRSDDITFGGVISGSGTLEKLGTNTLTLSGANTYTGATTITSGELDVSGSFGSTAITNNSILSFIGSSSTAGSAAITNTSAGSIYFNIDGDNGSTAGHSIINNNGSVYFYGGTAGYATINNNHIVYFTNTSTAGNAIITTNNGGTTYITGGGSGGAAQLITNAGGSIDISALGISGTTAGSIAGAGNYYLGAKSLTVGGNGLSSTVSGVIQDGGVYGGTGGSLTKTGAGTLTLSGINTYTGATTVDGGTLSVNGDISASTGVLVNAGGTLGGNGIVGDVSINGGTLSPGNSIGTLTVTGTFMMTAASTYLVQISGNSADKTIVAGPWTATLAGKVVVDPLTRLSATTTYTILDANSLSGTFDTATVLTSFARNARLNYVGNSVLLTLDPGLLSPNLPDTASGNQKRIAAAIDNALTAGAALPGAFNALFALTGDALGKALTQAAGETATGGQQTGFTAMTQFMGSMTDTSAAGRGGDAPGGAIGFADSNAYTSTAKNNAARDAFAMFSKAPLAKNYDPRWSVWASGFGGSQTTDGNAAAGSNTSTSRIAGVSVGADVLLSPQTIAGFAMAGAGTNFSVSGGGSGRSDLFQVGGFVRHTIGSVYLTGSAAYGWQDVTTNRAVMADQLQARFNASTFSGRFEAGNRYVTSWLGGLGLTPYAAVDVTAIALPGYGETATAGTNAFALTYASKTVTDTRSELGVRSDKSFAVKDAVLTLRGRAAWAHDYNTDRAASATFIALPGASFVVNGASPARDSALTTASVEMSFISGISLAATFEGEFSDVTRSYAGKGVVRYVW